MDLVVANAYGSSGRSAGRSTVCHMGRWPRINNQENGEPSEKRWGDIV